MVNSTDFVHADTVEIMIAEHQDGFRLWIDVDGRNVFRAYRIDKLVIDDRRIKDGI